MKESIRTQDLHVCVVGTGISGLRCASVLLAEGVRVTMLEARDRIGGRVCYPTSPSQALMPAIPFRADFKLTCQDLSK